MNKLRLVLSYFFKLKRLGMLLHTHCIRIDKSRKERGNYRLPHTHTHTLPDSPLFLDTPTHIPHLLTGLTTSDLPATLRVTYLQGCIQKMWVGRKFETFQDVGGQRYKHEPNYINFPKLTMATNGFQS